MADSPDSVSLNEPEKLSLTLTDDAAKLRRPMVFWSTVILFYFWGDIQFNLVATDDGTGIQTPWGVPITNVTEEKILWGLAIIHLYFYLRFMAIQLSALYVRCVEGDQEHLRGENQRRQNIARGWFDENYEPPELSKEEQEFRDRDNYLNLLQKIFRRLIKDIAPIVIPISLAHLRPPRS